MADSVQRPTGRPGVSIVLRGQRGTGKGRFVEHFGSLFGSHFVRVTQTSQLAGKFNAHLKSSLVVFADEAYWAGNKQDEGALKALITEEQIMIEPKGVDPFMVKNFVRLFFATNNEWAVPAGMDERRFLVLDVSNERTQDHDYFAQIEEEMTKGGREALLHFLLNYDLTGINLRKVPQTDALLEQKLLSLDSVGKYWYDILRDGAFEGEDRDWSQGPLTIRTRTVQDAYVAHAMRTGPGHRASDAELGKQLRKYCPGLDKQRRSAAFGFGREWHYEFPDLEDCRKQFGEAIGSQLEWDVDEEDC